MVQEIKRQIAYRLWISSLEEGKFIKTEGEWEPNYLDIKGIKVSRLNIIGTVVETFYNEEKLYASITLDDGTSTLRVKAWKDDSSLLKDLKKGDSVLVIGKLKEYQGEIYLTPEIVKIMNDHNWELLRKIELFKSHGKPKIVEVPENIEIRSSNNTNYQVKPTNEEPKMVLEEINIGEKPAETEKQRIINILEKSEFGTKIEEISSLASLNIQETESIIKSLVKEGEIYQNKPGYYKAI